MRQSSSYLFRAILLVALLTFFQGCNEPEIVTGPAVSQQTENDKQLQALTSYLADITGAPVEKIKYAGEEKNFIIDGDIEISRSSAEAYLNGEKTGRISQRQAVWLLKDEIVKDIKVYISPGVTPAWKTAIGQAIADWNSVTDTKVNFREVLIAPYADVIISTKYEAPPADGTANWVARQHLPKIDGTIGGGMTLNTYYNAETEMPITYKRFAVAHELGHAIGLSHTDIPGGNFVDYQVCGTPKKDMNSVMNSFVLPWAGFTSYDVIAARVLYPDHTWKYLPGFASDVAAGSGPDKSLWMISKTAVNGGYSIHNFNYATKTFTQVPGGAVRIAVGTGGIPWVVNSVGQIFKRVNSQWQQIPGSALDIAIGANGAVYIISTIPAPGGYAIKFWENNQWKQLPGRGAVRIAVTPYGEAWAVDNANKVLKRSGQGMVDSGGTGRDIASGQNGSIFVIGMTQVPGGYSVKKYENGCWVQLSGGGVAISAHGNGTGPVVISNLGLVMEY